MQLTPLERMSQAHLHPIHQTWTGFASLISSFSYSLKKLRAPFKAPSILICHPLLPSLMWNSGRWYTCQWACGQRPFHSGWPKSFTLLVHWHAGGRGRERMTRVLAFSPFCRWLVRIVPGQSANHGWTAIQWSRLVSGWYLCTLRIVQGLCCTNVLPAGSNEQF